MVQTYTGKAQVIQKGGKNATGSDKEGPREDPKSVRGRPISYGVTSRRKLKIHSHRLTKKRDMDSHPKNLLGVLKGKPQRGIHHEFGSSQTHSHKGIKTGLH